MMEPDLVFRVLEDGEVVLARELFAFQRQAPTLDSNAIGLDRELPGTDKANTYGIFIQGDLVGAGWLGGGREAEILAAVVARRWSGTGLMGWLVQRLTAAAADQGRATVRVDVRGQGEKIGELLRQAGFSGPDPEAETFPAGTWTWDHSAANPTVS